MSVREIRLFGDPVLRSVADPVADPGHPRVRALVDDLLDTVELPGRAGVAAPQIGVGLRVFSYNVDGQIGYLINPELIELGGEPLPVDEGCLSVPGFFFPRVRHAAASARGLDVDGRTVEVAGEGLLAQALQHEIDHLDGKLYIEGLEPEVKRDAMRAVRASDWFAR